MKKWLVALIMIIGIVLLPTYLTAEVTQAEGPSPRTGGVEDSTTQFTLSLPFNVSSHWTSADITMRGIIWRTGDSYTRFAIQNGQFVPTDPTDTWFVYGWFGPIEAILKPYNVKYPKWNNRHNGIDFAGRIGLEIVSASNGIVTFAGPKIGNTVIVEAGNGYRITYGHLLDIKVRPGERIAAGDLIGHLGDTGTANPHLHFQVDRVLKGERTAINPLTLIDADWNEAITPDTAANRFYAGPAGPAQQPNFTW